MTHPALFGPHFEGDSWVTWVIVMKALFLHPLTEAELVKFKEIAGDRDPPTSRVREFWAVVGRGGGKNSVASAIATYTAAFFDPQQRRLRVNERPLVACIASNRKQAKEMLRYIQGLFSAIPRLKAMVTRETAEGFELSNGVDIEVYSASFRAIRGRTVLMAILDEVAFFRDESSALPDEALYDAVMPAIARIAPLGMLISISSPHRKAGLLFRKFQRHHGKDLNDVLVIQAPTQTMNPAFSQAEIDRAYEEDPTKALAEYGAQFRGDISGWLSLEAIQATVDVGVKVRPPHPIPAYRAFIDPAGGTGQDSFCLAIAHDDGGTAVLDCTIERRPPFNPIDVIGEIAATLDQYGLKEATGDRWAAGLNTAMFDAAGIVYRNSDRDRSAIYSDVLPLFTSGRVRLLDDARIVSQFASLERKTSSGGKDVINHPVGGHDDLCNAVAGALVAATARDRRAKLTFG